MEKIRSLQHIDIDELYLAWADAFKDYERTWTREELEVLLKRRGYVPALSFAAFDGDKPVSFTLNGIGVYNGIYTAYDTGTGTMEAYRGQGLASKIFEHSLPYLHEAGCTQYILEVLHYNEKAISIYRAAGFEVARELNYFVQPMEILAVNSKTLPPGYEMSESEIDMELMSSFWDFHPSWQNSFESLKRVPDDFVTIGAFHNGQLVGYGITEPGSGDITQLAVDREHRRKGIGSAIFKALLAYNRHPAAKVVNTHRINAIVTAFVENNGVPNIGWQYEMVREIG
ncbi:MAG TPA: GNAT family N-acetyltransferase [Flavipsychrobacter sp.]|nr:GNAT family N-acetyltransferase [Flavipsychrobacter sp.]